MAGYDDDLRFAHVLADAADDITTRRFRALDLRVEAKPDLTPVTDADQATEESLRNVLRRARPRDAVLGEEFGRAGAGPRCWVIDPIDGDQELRPRCPGLGHPDRPDGRRRGRGRRGVRAGAGPPLVGRAGRRRLDRPQPDQGHPLPGLRGHQAGGRLVLLLRAGRLGGARPAGRVPRAGRSVWRTRAYGDFWSHVLVAEGAVDVSAEPEVSLWDLAALQVIVEEAGGTFTDLGGRPPRTAAARSASTACCTRRFLKSSPADSPGYPRSVVVPVRANPAR